MYIAMCCRVDLLSDDEDAEVKQVMLFMFLLTDTLQQFQTLLSLAHGDFYFYSNLQIIMRNYRGFYVTSTAIGWIYDTMLMITPSY